MDLAVEVLLNISSLLKIFLPESSIFFYFLLSSSALVSVLLAILSTTIIKATKERRIPYSPLKISDYPVLFFMLVFIFLFYK
jgi:hypothetical protein